MAVLLSVARCSLGHSDARQLYSFVRCPASSTAIGVACYGEPDPLLGVAAQDTSRSWSRRSVCHERRRVLFETVNCTMPNSDALARTAPTSAPYGTWSSPITARAVAAGALRLGGIAVDNDEIYWVESRPNEGGRQVIVKRNADGRIIDVTPKGTNVRTRVHEYGGGA